MDTLTLTIGETTPDFTLQDLDGNAHHLESYRGRVVVLNFWSGECPWSARADEGINALQEKWGEEVVVLAIASNANEDLPLLQEAALTRAVEPVLVDGEQTVARLYGAEYTPQIFVLDIEGILLYQGAYDDVTFRQKEPTRNYLEEAVASLLNGKQPDPSEVPAYGCTVVYYREV